MSKRTPFIKFSIIVSAAIVLFVAAFLLCSCSNDKNKIEDKSEYPNTIAESAKISDEYNDLSQKISTTAISEFLEFSKIPRKSGHMDAIRNYIMSWSKNNGLTAVLDPSGNIYLDLPASAGQENTKNLIFQAHMDMVSNVADSNTSFDPLTSSLNLVYDKESGQIHSKDYQTNIGADDGQGLCLCMALAKHSKEFNHGPIRLLFTYDEETTFEGVKKLDASLLNADYLINLDTERCGVCEIASAGDFLIKFDKKYVCSPPTEKNNSENMTIKVSGLKGGHSGSDIDKPRTSAVQILKDYLNKMKDDVVHFRIVSIDCGKANNIISDSLTFTININKKNEEEAKNKFNDVINDVKKQFPDDKDLTFDISINSASGEFPSKQESEKILDVLNCIPHGVIEKDSNNKVKTSCNLGIIKFNNGILSCEALYRSSKNSVLDEKIKEVTNTLKSKKIEINITDNDRDPAWEAKETSLSKMYLKSLKDCCDITGITNSTPGVLETSVFVDKKPNLQCISIGGDVKDEHMLTETFFTKSLPVTATSVIYILDHANDLN